MPFCQRKYKYLVYGPTPILVLIPLIERCYEELFSSLRLRASASPFL
jgi:hypothetical protein